MQENPNILPFYMWINYKIWNRFWSKKRTYMEYNRNNSCHKHSL